MQVGRVSGNQQQIENTGTNTAQIGNSNPLFSPSQQQPSRNVTLEKLYNSLKRLLEKQKAPITNSGLIKLEHQSKYFCCGDTVENLVCNGTTISSQSEAGFDAVKKLLFSGRFSTISNVRAIDTNVVIEISTPGDIDCQVVTINAEHEVYKGGWKDNKRRGYGTMTYANGDHYKGGWKDNKRCGQGTMTYADGSVHKGEWENDLPQAQKPPANAVAVEGLTLPTFGY